MFPNKKTTYKAVFEKRKHKFYHCVCVCACICMYVLYVYMCVCTCVCVFVCLRVCVCVCMCFMCVCVCVHLCEHTKKYNIVLIFCAKNSKAVTTYIKATHTTLSCCYVIKNSSASTASRIWRKNQQLHVLLQRTYTFSAYK